ncbi:hypothetical protein GYMLUDRAFT_87577 [Collybiopsis luxurians FD-317 M1]|uniref:AB hydrolase-1 domain-containing protein n=1 Tax=Collybiopsis luxurians FD-317 M1 TaxID=944289 RepID=A0A0D0AY45_9AGAR|nr:hypothetical protein GYMLUDRAFT_87577 [Collybiopsis luxurians FD-317 M1]
MADSLAKVPSYPRPAEIPAPPNLPKYLYPGLPVELASVYPPPEHVLEPKPELPSGQRSPIWHEDKSIPYALTTHIVPAAYLREDPDDVLPESPSADGKISKDERKILVEKTEARLREMRRKYEDEERRRQEKALWVCLNRYVRTETSKKGGYTLFFAHANGFHKEAFEPLIWSLLSSPESQSLVQEIWVWEAYSHGDSALLNKGRLNSFSHTRSPVRDLLNFLIYFLPSSPNLQPLPVHLPRVRQAEVERRLRNGFLGPGSPRLPICCFGHSFGGAVSTLAAITHPALFTSLFLIDPVILYPTVDFYFKPSLLSLGAISRRASWKSREEARKGFLESPFFRTWDPRVLDLYVEAGLYLDKDTDTIRLKTSPIQEALLFNDAQIGGPEAWVRLWKKELDARIKLRWAMPGPGKPELDSRDNTSQQRVWLRPENASNIRIDGAGHLIVQEKPDALGKQIGVFLKELSSETRARL